MRIDKLLLIASFSALSVGCSLGTSAPVRSVAYDFSDYAYYDKPFATSPSYAQDAQPQRASNASNLSARGSASALSAFVAVRPATEDDVIVEVPATEFGTIDHQ